MKVLPKEIIKEITSINYVALASEIMEKRGIKGSSYENCAKTNAGKRDNKFFWYIQSEIIWGIYQRLREAYGDTTVLSLETNGSTTHEKLTVIAERFGRSQAAALAHCINKAYEELEVAA